MKRNLFIKAQYYIPWKIYVTINNHIQAGKVCPLAIDVNSDKYESP